MLLVSSDGLLFINLFQFSLAVERRELVVALDKVLLLYAVVTHEVSLLGLRMTKLISRILILLRHKLFTRRYLFRSSQPLARSPVVFFPLTLFGRETPIENILLVDFGVVLFLRETLICVIILHDVGSDWILTGEHVIFHSFLSGKPSSATPTHRGAAPRFGKLNGLLHLHLNFLKKS